MSLNEYMRWDCIDNVRGHGLVRCNVYSLDAIAITKQTGTKIWVE